jgi:hypothetical protein
MNAHVTDPKSNLLTVYDEISDATVKGKALLLLILDHGNRTDQDRFETDHSAVVSGLYCVFDLLHRIDQALEVLNAAREQMGGGK